MDEQATPSSIELPFALHGRAYAPVRGLIEHAAHEARCALTWTYHKKYAIWLVCESPDPIGGTRRQEYDLMNREEEWVHPATKRPERMHVEITDGKGTVTRLPATLAILTRDAYPWDTSEGDLIVRASAHADRKTCVEALMSAYLGHFTDGGAQGQAAFERWIVDELEHARSVHNNDEDLSRKGVLTTMSEGAAVRVHALGEGAGMEVSNGAGDGMNVVLIETAADEELDMAPIEGMWLTVHGPDTHISRTDYTFEGGHELVPGHYRVARAENPRDIPVVRFYRDEAPAILANDIVARPASGAWTLRVRAEGATREDGEEEIDVARLQAHGPERKLAPGSIRVWQGDGECEHLIATTPWARAHGFVMRTRDGSVNIEIA